jgi:titin
MQGFNECIRVKSKMQLHFSIECTICIILFSLIPVFQPPAVYASDSSLLAPPPANPSNLNVQTVSHVRIDLSWTDNSTDEVGFKVERKTGAAGTYAEIVTTGANVTSFTDPALSASTGYYYRVRAYNASGFSGYTNEANATTLPNPITAPDNLTATVISQTKINLAWADNSTNETGFKIERRPSTATTYTVIATVGANVTSRADSGLAANTKYFYRLRAFNASGNSAYATAVSATTLPFPPAAPGNLTATVISNKQIDLAWADNSGNETGFKIERKTGNAGAYAQIATVGANVTSFSSAGLKANTKYYYRVRANNAGGNSPYSNAVNAITLRNPPAAPGNLTATTINQSQIKLTWVDNSGNEAGFKIERKIPQGGTSAYAEIATVAANVTSYSNAGLSAGTQYFYRIRAVNSGGASAYSNEANATTLPGAPAPPENLTAATISSSQISVAWTDNSTNETGFKIERKTGNAGTFAQIATVGANVTNFLSSGLNSNTKYFYRVRAYNSGGNSAYSTAVNATTLPKTPTAPSNLTAAAMINLQIKIAWKDNAFNENTFLIERKPGTAGAYEQIATAGPNAASYTDVDLNPVTTYFYRVRASNLGGASIYTNEANATTLANPPLPPDNLTTTVFSQTQIKLTWNDNSGDENGFAVERKTASGIFQQILTTGANIKSYSDTGLVQGTEYFYRVRAYNANGFSDYSTEAGNVTLPAPPAGASSLAATPLSNGKIRLEWSDNSNSESGFKIERQAGAAGTYAQVATVEANVQSFIDSGLVAATLYFFRVQAFNPGGHSDYSNEANATTLPDPPATPGNLTTTTISKNQINLAWIDNSTTENGFRIERKTGATGMYSEIVSVGANVKTYPDISLAQDTPYFYRVCAFNAGGQSDFSNESASTTLPDPPAKPGSLTATAASNVKINLAWKDSSNNESGFKIERKKTATGTYAQIATVGANVTALADSTLLANTVYFYRVRAFNAGGNSNYSFETSAKTLPNPPLAPGSLTVTAVSTSQINLTWTDNSANESGFRIERKIGATGVYTVIAAASANVINFLDGGLSTASPYFYRVRAFNAGGNSNYSNEVKAVTLPRGPGALTAATVSNTKLSLAWTDSSDNETGFKIERKISGGLYAEIAATVANVKTFTDSLSLSPNTTFFYRVRAINTGGFSAYSNEASAKTLPNPPAAPDSVRATAISDARIDLAWADRSHNEAGFKIERKIGAAGAYVQIATVAANVKIFSDGGLAVNTAYFYRVRAFNAGGHSVYSNEANTVTLPIVPGSVRGEPLTNHKIALAWTDSSANESGFKIERKLSGGEYVEIAQAGANVNAYADSNLVANTEYFYRLRAFNAGGHSAYSNEVSVTTLPNPPATPSGLAATTISNRQIDLAWLDSSDNEIGFAIERKTGDGVFEQVGTVEANVTTYADTTLVERTQYFYRLFAFNTGGNSDHSMETNATTLPDPPAEPTGLTATVAGSSQINLTWLDNSDDEDGFRLERQTDSVYVEIAVFGANVTSYADIGLTAEVTHYYRLRAFNIGGNSAYSGEANATPSDDTNLALNQPILASSTEASSATGPAVDGNLNTFWQSGSISPSAPQAWLRVELTIDAPIVIDRVAVRWHQTYFAKEYDVQVSDNGTSWTTVYTNNAGVIGAQELSFTAASARYVRLYMRKNNKTNYRVAEFEVYFGFAKTRHNAAKNETIIPATLALAQNYPNPFNPSTTISYSLPQGMSVTLKVINIAGQEVATLADGYRDRGIYRVMFNARRLPSGVYYAVLQAGETRQVRRMVLAK